VSALRCLVALEACLPSCVPACLSLAPCAGTSRHTHAPPPPPPLLLLLLLLDAVTSCT